MIAFLITSLLTLFAGVLTAFAPCVLPLLPIILGGSLVESENKKRPYIIIASLLVALILFTLLLKTTTLLLSIDVAVWQWISGIIVILLGIFMLFPTLWARVIGLIGFEHRAQAMLSGGMKQKDTTVGAIITGAALGPVFASCSPTYTWLVVTVLPRSFTEGLWYLVLYCIGLAGILLAVALVGKKLLKNARWAVNPYGWFQRTIAVLFIIVGIVVITGFDKVVQAYFIEVDPIGIKQLEKQITPF